MKLPFRAEALDRRDFSRMNGLLEKHGWANIGSSRYKHSSMPGTVILHTHTYGGVAWHHTGHESNRGVNTLSSYLQKIHNMHEVTASAAIGTQSSTGDPNWDDDADVKPKKKRVGDSDTEQDDVSDARKESVESIHIGMQRNYFSHIGTHRRQNETLSRYARIHPKDGSVETVSIKFLPDNEQWEHRHYGVIHKGKDAESLSNFLTTRSLKQ